MDSVNILHDGCSGEDRGKKYSKLATTEQFYGAGTSKKVVPLRWCKATTAHAFTIGSPTVISIHEKTWIFHGFSREYRRMHHWGHFQWPGTVVWDISNEKYFHQISNSYFELYFCKFSSKNAMLFIGFLCTIMMFSHKTAGLLLKIMKISTKLSKKHDPKYELEIWWKYFPSEMSQTRFPGHWKCFQWCLWWYFLENPLKIYVFFMFVGYCRDSNRRQ